MSVFDRTIVSCPYNPEHKVRRPRLLWHLAQGCPDEVTNSIELFNDLLLKKAKAHLFSICPYNCLHIIPKEEFEAHKADCPDGKLLKIYNYQADDIWMSEVPTFKPSDTWESWDNPDKLAEKIVVETSEMKAEPDWKTDWDLSKYFGQIRLTEAVTNESSPNQDSEGEKKDLEADKFEMEEEEVSKENVKGVASYEEEEKLEIFGE